MRPGLNRPGNPVVQHILDAIIMASMRPGLNRPGNWPGDLNTFDLWMLQ